MRYGKISFLRSEQSIIPQAARKAGLRGVKYDALRPQLAAIHRKVPCPVSFLNIDRDPQCLSDLPGYRLPIRGNLPLNLLRAAQRGEPVSFSVRDFRGITYVRQAVALLEPALTLPGGVYNFGSENTENMVLTARQFAETLGIAVDIQEANWARNLAMDCSKLRAQGIVFDTTQAGLTRCLRDYGLR